MNNTPGNAQRQGAEPRRASTLNAFSTPKPHFLCKHSNFWFVYAKGKPKEPSLWFADCTQQIREVKQAITSTYLIPKEHFVILEGEHGLCAAILVAMTDDNAAIIEHEMEGQGFRIASPTDMICIADSQQRRWVEMRFAPAAPDDVTFELKLKYSTVYCVVPSELEASVEKHGIPAPVSIIRGDATMEEIQEFANHQPRHTHRQPLASEYTLFAIDLSKIDRTIRFHGSIHVPKPLHTTTPIPPTALTKIKGNDIHVVPVII